MKYPVHPVAEMFPLIPEGSKDWEELIESIEANGQIEEIILDGDLLLDGRNRLRACEKLGIEPKTKQWSELRLAIPTAEWIACKNLSRRNLTPDQKAQIAFDIQQWQAREMAEKRKAESQFKPGKSANPGGKPKVEVNTKSCSPERDAKEMHARSTVGQVAAAAGVSHHKAAQAAQVAKAVESGVLPESVKEDVKAGKVKLSQATKRIPKEKKTPPCLRVRVEKKLKTLLASFPADELPEVKQILRELL